MFYPCVPEFGLDRRQRLGETGKYNFPILTRKQLYHYYHCLLLVGGSWLLGQDWATNPTHQGNENQLGDPWREPPPVVPAVAWGWSTHAPTPAEQQNHRHHSHHRHHPHRHHPDDHGIAGKFRKKSDIMIHHRNSKVNCPKCKRLQWVHGVNHPVPVTSEIRSRWPPKNYSSPATDGIWD